MSHNHLSYLDPPQISRGESGCRRQIASRLFALLLLNLLAFHSSCTFDNSNLGECRRDSECASGFCFHNVCMPTELFPDVQTPQDATSEPDVTILDVESDAALTDGDADGSIPEDMVDQDGTVLDVATDGDADGSTPEDIVDQDGTVQDVADLQVSDILSDAPCIADADYCDGDILVACTGEGFPDYVDCTAAATCPDDPFGCHCSAGECTPRVCRPDTTGCLGNTRIQCDSTGSEYEELSECTIGTICLAGSCVEDSCDPGTWDCINDVLIECSTDGEIDVVRDCGASGHACNAGLQQCRCGLTTACEADEACSNPASGECLCGAQVCDPGEFCDGVDGCRCGSDDTNCFTGSTCESDACVCAPGRYGPDCSNPCACLNGAVCDDGAGGTGACTCLSGFWDTFCDQPCSTCDHGVCNDGVTGDGTCICDEGYWDTECDQTCSTCDHGVCNDGATGNGTCICDEGYWDTECDQTCSTCDHGVCNDRATGNGTCICDEGYWDTECDQTCSTCDHGVCNDGATGNGTCICDEGYWDTECDQTCSTCDHGVCNDGATGNGTCICDEGYWDTECDQGCSTCDHGVCNDGATGDGTCICDEDYWGATCNNLCVCNGSPCDDGVLGGGTCDCNENTYGTNCALCPPCDHGTCDDGLGGTGNCLCDDGYHGSLCSTPCGCDADAICDNGVGRPGTCLVRNFTVQRGTAEIIGGTDTVTITTEDEDYVAPTHPFFVRLVNTRLSGMGRTTSGAPHQNERWMAWVQDTSDYLSTITFKRNSSHSSNCFLTWEIIEYDGASDGDNAMVVHEQGIIPFTGGDADALSLDTGPVAGTSDSDDIVVFITGQGADGSEYDTANSGLFTAAWIDEGMSLPKYARFTRAADAEDDNLEPATVSYAIVEFTGANWSVQRVSFPHTTAGSIETESDFTDVGDISRAFFHAQFRTGLHQVGALGAEVWFSGTQQLSFFVQPGAGTTGMTSVVWVVSNTDDESAGRMIVDHYNLSRWGGTAERDTWTDTITPVDFVAHSSIMGETARSAWVHDDESVPRGSISLLLSTVSEVELYQCDANDGRKYTFSIVQWPAD